MSGCGPRDKLGEEGWELVAAIPITELGITNMIYFVLKREMLSEGKKKQK